MKDIEVILGSHKLSNKFQSVSATGWMIACLDGGYFVFTDFIKTKLNITSNRLTFAEFKALAHAADQDRVAAGIELLGAYGVFDANFRVGSTNHSVRVSFNGMEKEKKLGHVSYGCMSFFDRRDDTQSIFDIVNHQYRELRYWQSNIPRSLNMLLENSSFKAVVSDMLNSIIDRFEADRSCFFEFDWSTNTQACICEATGKNIQSDQHVGESMHADHFSWLVKQFESSEVVVINNIQDLPSEAANEIEAFSSQDIVSIMITPMKNSKGLWGYLSIAYVAKEHHWTEMEIGWFTAVSNIASISLALHYSNKEIRYEKSYLQYLQKNMPVGLEIYDRDGVLIDENDKAMEMIGFRSKEEMLDMKIQLFDNTFIPEQKREALRRGESIQCEILLHETPFSIRFFKNTSGEHKNLTLSATALFDENNNIVNYITILSDHTEAMQAYAKLKEFDNMFKTISEFSEVGFFKANLLDPTGDLFATDQWFTNLNIPKEYIHTLSGIIPDTIHPEDAALLGNFIKTAISDASIVEQQIEIRVCNYDKSIKWLHSSVKVVERNIENNRVIIFGVTIDITNIKNVELALIKAKNEAEESNRLKSSFLANMSHEIRTPLNAIIGFSTLIAESAQDDELHEFALLVNKNSDLLLQLISDVLDISRMEAGIFDITLSNTNINSLCEEIIQSNTLDHQDGVDIIFENHLPTCKILCDRNRITQILNNLVGNAIKFTEEGVIKLGYNIMLLDRQQYVEFYVHDTGLGMTPEQAEICFERFVKINSFVQGLGLGLSISKMLVEKLGGTIGVDTTFGAGSRFWFRLPFDPTEGTEDMNDDLMVYLDEGRKPVVLIAEDMKVNFLLISKMLSPYYTIVLAQDGEEAIKIHSQQNIDLILMDLKMPKIGGLEATRIIRQADQKTPIVAITAFAFDFDRDQAIEAGCNYLITKPINQIQLRKIIRKLILNGTYTGRTH